MRLVVLKNAGLLVAVVVPEGTSPLCIYSHVVIHM